MKCLEEIQKRCLRAAKADFAGVGMTPTRCDEKLFGWKGKGVERSREERRAFR